MGPVLTCGHCGDPGRLTLAREADSLIWKGETLMHTECGEMGDPVDFYLAAPGLALDLLEALDLWLYGSIEEEEVLRRVLEDL